MEKSIQNYDYSIPFYKALDFLISISYNMIMVTDFSFPTPGIRLHERLHYFDKTPLTLVVSEFGVQDFKYIVPYGKHTIEGYSLHYILRGKGTFVYNDKSTACKAGDVIITFPGVIVQFIPDADEPWEYFYAMINEQGIRDLIFDAHFSMKDPTYSVQHKKEADEIFDRLLQSKSPKSNYRLRAMSAILELFAYIIEERKENKKQNRVDSDFYVQSAIAYIESNYYNPYFSVDELCTLLNISYPYLYKLFHKKLGTSITTYLKLFRMREVRILLDAGERISVAAEKCGYNDFSYFSKEFKKLYNMTPVQYRKLQYTPTPPPKKDKK